MSFAGKAHQVMLQGVHELYELNETPQLWEENQRINRLVFIGEDMHTLHSWIQQCLLHYHSNDFKSICDHAAIKLCVSAPFCRKKPGQGRSAGTVYLCSGAGSRQKIADSSSLAALKTVLWLLAIQKSGTVFSNIQSFPTRA